MKMSLCAKEKNINSLVDERFARAKFFVIYDLKTKDVEFLENPIDSEHGSGPKAIQFLAEKGVNIIIAPPLGKNAHLAAETAKIKVVEQSKTTVIENIESYLNNSKTSFPC